MRKPAFPRIIGLCILYGLIFTGIVTLQFSQQGNFSRRIGSLLVNGQYVLPGDKNAEAPGSREGVPYLLVRGAKVFFGGLEFSLMTGAGESTLGLENADGSREPALPESIAISGERVIFRLPGGTEFSFSAWDEGGFPQLRISAVFAEGIRAVFIPFRPQGRSRTRITGENDFMVNADGLDYRFIRTEIDPEKHLLVLKSGAPSISYGASSGEDIFDPAEYTRAAAAESDYDGVIRVWRDRVFAYWGSSNQHDEDEVIAYGGEALERNAFRANFSRISSAFLSGGAARSYESSVYIGRLEEALVSLSRVDGEKFPRLSRALMENSPDFLRESHGLEYLSIRDVSQGSPQLVDEAAAFARSLDPAALDPGLFPGIFEAFIDWQKLRPGANPFETLIEDVLAMLQAGIKEDPLANRILYFSEGAAEMEFNLRLGKALTGWAESAVSPSWAAVGRSLVLSVLAFNDDAGAVPSSIRLSPAGVFIEEPGADRVSAARLYRVLQPGKYYPHAASLCVPGSGFWAWTTAAAVSTVENTDSMDFLVNLSEGETHYMLIRGLKPFTRLRFNDQDFRSDPRFEQYDSSGWVYSTGEQTLMLKLRQRSAQERVRIIFSLPPPPPPSVPAAEPEAVVPGNQAYPWAY